MKATADQQALVDHIASRTGYRFHDPVMLETAFTHPSVARRPNYQRLEFLGDRVLGLVIADWLMAQFPRDPEGRLNRRLTALVRRETLARVCQEVGLVDLILLDPSTDADGGRDQPAVLADICEAFIGALYLDGGIDEARAFIRKHWDSRLMENEAVAKDAKTALQEWAQARRMGLPSYELVSRTGPDHAPSFAISVALGGGDPVEGQGTSKREAEQAAATAMMIRVGAWDEDPHHG